MREENLHKISEFADRTISDTATANILLCYVLQQTTRSVNADLLYDIAVTSGIISYFTFQDAIGTMLQTGLLICEQKNQETQYTLTESGADIACRLYHLTGKSYRDEILETAKQLLKRHETEEQVKISYEPIPQGCHLHICLKDHDLILLQLTLFTPDEHQAKLLGEKILANPSAIYHNILKAVIPKQKK